MNAQIIAAAREGPAWYEWPLMFLAWVVIAALYALIRSQGF